MFEHMTLRRRPATALVAVLGLLLALLSLQAAPAHAAGKLTATFASADNGSWWKGTYVLHNDTDTAVTGWSLEFDLPAGVAIDTSYNGTVTTQGQPRHRRQRPLQRYGRRARHQRAVQLLVRRDRADRRARRLPDQR